MEYVEYIVTGPDINEIIQTEWGMFQQVNNIGGRAACQDDLRTFQIMRASQYENWTEQMIACYLPFLRECSKSGRNLVEEKYARMMRFTDARYYDENLAAYIEPVPAENSGLVDQILKILIKWEQDFAAAYPHLAGAGRPVTSEEDTSGYTSMETYERGELETYPKELLLLYLDYVEKLKNEGRSMSVMIQDTMVKCYGYASIQDAEDHLRR